MDAGAAIETCSRAARLDALNALVPFGLGRAYLAAGRLEEAHRAFARAAELGSSAAKLEVGRDFAAGCGVKVDPRAAVDWYRRAAEGGDPGAALDHALSLELGKAGEPDIAAAMTWYRKAAESGNKWAMLRLADAFSLGEGVARDRGKAAEWYRRAAEQGLPRAMTAVGLRLAEEGGIRAEESSIDWFRQAAGMGDAVAVVELAKRAAVDEAGSRSVEALARADVARLLDPAAKPAPSQARGLARVDVTSTVFAHKQIELWSVLDKSGSRARLYSGGSTPISLGAMESARKDLTRLSMEILRGRTEQRDLRAAVQREASAARDAEATVRELRTMAAIAQTTLDDANKELARLREFAETSRATEQSKDVRITELTTQVGGLQTDLDIARRRVGEMEVRPAADTIPCVDGHDPNGYVWTFYGSKVTGSEDWSYRWFDAVLGSGGRATDVTAPPTPGMMVRPVNDTRTLRCFYPLYSGADSKLAEVVSGGLSSTRTLEVKAVMHTERNSFWIGLLPPN